MVNGGIAFAGTMGLALLAPVITFYLFKDWPGIRLHEFKVIWDLDIT